MKKTKNESPAGNLSPRDTAVQEKLETLKKEYKDLDTLKIRTDQDIANLQKQLDDLEKQAVAEYGTSDLAELEKILEERRQENELRVQEYEQHIQAVKDSLAKIEEPGSGGES
ncbi:hypothetical protein [Desulfobacca acetoxidans]|uniref:Uncharacterized protein n=1 Tax=Desulfobacca acetoxidans (strain ATCC 700848 / DSM 11109 / ASRB2) TaxID=880072 RepID=F2NIY4_DESAR|nr:hypothetical protein [Desulfobacca acetoxidans]AEB10749.1 hypothetical protein Desac_2950 [Desulfobacca acetoxidans DSM 11109]